MNIFSSWNLLLKALSFQSGQIVPNWVINYLPISSWCHKPSINGYQSSKRHLVPDHFSWNFGGGGIWFILARAACLVPPLEAACSRYLTFGGQAGYGSCDLSSSLTEKCTTWNDVAFWILSLKKNELEYYPSYPNLRSSHLKQFWLVWLSFGRPWDQRRSRSCVTGPEPESGQIYCLP